MNTDPHYAVSGAGLTDFQGRLNENVLYLGTHRAVTQNGHVVQLTTVRGADAALPIEGRIGTQTHKWDRAGKTSQVGYDLNLKANRAADRA